MAAGFHVLTEPSINKTSMNSMEHLQSHPLEDSELMTHVHPNRIEPAGLKCGPTDLVHRASMKLPWCTLESNLDI